MDIINICHILYYEYSDEIALFPQGVSINVTTLITTTETTEANTTFVDVCCNCQFEDSGGREGCFHPETGEGDEVCNDEICPFDNYCCNQRWDGLCQAQAATRCNNGNRPICCGCTTGQGQGNPNCQSDPECEDIICPNDGFCCGEDNGFWDLLCVNQALTICEDMINEGLPQQSVSERRRMLDEELREYSRI